MSANIVSSTAAQKREEIAEMLDEEAILYDGFDAALIGTGNRCSMETVAVYEYDLCIKVLMERDGMEYEDAVDYFEFNVLGGYVGVYTPIIFTRLFKDYAEEKGVTENDLQSPKKVLESDAEKAARQQGIAPADVVISLVRNLPDEEVADAESKTWGAKVIEQWRREGVVGLFTDRPGDALEVAHNLRDDMLYDIQE